MLSLQEASTLGYGFAAHNVSLNEAKDITTSTRTRSPTSYATAMGASSSDKGFCPWWLRSPDYSSEKTMRSVGNNGYGSHTNLVDKTDVGVVPALYIKLQ